MKRRNRILFALCTVSLYTASAWADLVHVVEQREVDGVTTVMRDETKITGMPWATAPAPSVDGAIFTHWTISTQQDFAARDAWGRAYDAPRFKLYEDTTLTAHYLPATRDTDGDGFTFAEEIANGTNPLMPDSAVEGPIAYADSDTLEANLQPFDPATGAVVDDTFDELFTSPFAGNGATSRTFGPNARPVVTDVNGDGLFDLVILYDGGYAVYLNGGTAGNPMFTRAEGVSTNGLDLAQGSLAALDGLTLDRNVALDLPQSATIEISDSHPLVPSLVAVHVADASVASETEFELPVTVTSTEVLTNFTAEVTWDTALLEFRGRPSHVGGFGRNTLRPSRVDLDGGRRLCVEVLCEGPAHRHGNGDYAWLGVGLVRERPCGGCDVYGWPRVHYGLEPAGCAEHDARRVVGESIEWRGVPTAGTGAGTRRLHSISPEWSPRLTGTGTAVPRAARIRRPNSRPRRSWACRRPTCSPTTSGPTRTWTTAAVATWTSASHRSTWTAGTPASA